MRQAVSAGLDGAAVAALDRDEADEESAADATPVSASQRAEFLAFLDEVNQPPTEAEMQRITAAFERRHDLQKAHPLSVSAHEYMEIAAGVLAALRPMLADRGDPIAMASLDTIARFAGLIQIKTWRATGALVADAEDEWEDDEFNQSDGNGCAKLVRLVIAESREAWEVLMQIGSAAADGVPAAMIRRLDDLDEGIAAAFPNAMAFVRAGFDEGV